MECGDLQGFLAPLSNRAIVRNNVSTLFPVLKATTEKYAFVVIAQYQEKRINFDKKRLRSYIQKMTLHGHFIIILATSSKYTRDFRKFVLAYERQVFKNVRKDRRKDKFSPGGVYASSSFDAGDVAGGDNSCYKKSKRCSSR